MVLSKLQFRALTRFPHIPTQVFQLMKFLYILKQVSRISAICRTLAKMLPAVRTLEEQCGQCEQCGQQLTALFALRALFSMTAWYY